MRDQKAGLLHSAHDLDKHTAQVQACAVTGDGHTVVSASDDGSVLVWDLHGPRASLRKLTDGADEVFDVNVSRDGSRAVTASKDGAIRFWLLSSGECVATEQSCEELLASQVTWANDSWLSADGTVVVGVYSSSTMSEIVVYRWGKEDGRVSGKRSMIFRDRIVGLTVSAKQKIMAFYSPVSSAVHIVDLQTFDELRCVPLDDVTCLPGLAAATNAPALVVADNTQLLVLHPNDESMDVQLRGYVGAERRTPCDINADGSRVVSATENGCFALWDTTTRECIANLSSHPSMATACAISADAGRVVTGYDDGLVRAWDTSTMAVQIISESDFAEYYFRTHFGAASCDLDKAIYCLSGLLKEQGLESPPLVVVAEAVDQACGGVSKLRITETEFRRAFAKLRAGAKDDMAQLHEQWVKMFDKYAATSVDNSLLIFASAKLLLMQIFNKLRVQATAPNANSNPFATADALRILGQHAKKSDMKIYKDEFVAAAEEVAEIARNKKKSTTTKNVPTNSTTSNKK